MNTDCTAIQLLAIQAGQNIAIILIAIIAAILVALYCCLYLSGTISQAEEEQDRHGNVQS